MPLDAPRLAPSDLQRLIIEQPEQGLIAIDRLGELILCNGAALRLLGHVPSSAPVDQWPERCGAWLPDHRARPAVAEFPLTRAIRGESTNDLELCIGHQLAQRCVLVRASGIPLRGAHGQVLGGVMVLRGAMAHGNERPPLDFPALSKTVAAAAQERPTAVASLQAAIDAICATIGWPVGHFFWQEEGGTGLSSSGVWHIDPARSAFREAREAKRVGPGPGLIGNVLGSSKPVWIADLAAAADRDRQGPALEAGLRCALALPITTSKGVAGVLELFHDHPLAFDAQLVRQVGDVVSQLGPVFERDEAQRREQFLSAVVDNVAHPIFVKDREFRFVLLNKALCQLVGRSRGQMLGKTDYDFFPKPEADFFRKKDLEMFRSASPVVIDEEPITDAAGNRHVLSTTKVPLRGASGEVTHLVGIIHDITRLKAAEEQARQLAQEQFARSVAEVAQRRTELLASASRLLSTSLDFEGTVEVAARLAVPEFADCCWVLLRNGERPRVAAIQMRPGFDTELALVSQLDQAAPLAADEVIRSGKPELLAAGTVEELVARRWLASTWAPSTEEFSSVCVPIIARGRPEGALLFARLGAKQPYGEDDLLLAEQLGHRIAMALDNASLYAKAQEAIRARDEFLSIASHELRTPLTTLKLQVSRLLAATGASPQVRGAELMQRQIDRLTLLISNLLDVSRVAAGRLVLSPCEVDLVDVVHDVAERLSVDADQAGSTLQLSVPAALIGRWDKLRIEQVVTNLLSNAIKYGAGKPIEVAIAPDDRSVQLTVRDHGIGIAQADLARIFERFERSAAARGYSGMGLGLFITRQIVLAHGGSITVRSEPDQGSVFAVTLPLDPHLNLRPRS